MSGDGKDSSVEQEVYRMFTKTFILLDDYDRTFFAEYGLSMRQFWAIQHLSERQGCSMVDLSRVLFTDKSNVTGIVDRLERLKLVTRTPDPKDRRVILIALTSDGERLHHQVKEQHDTRINQLMGVLRKNDLHLLLAYLHAVSQNIEGYLLEERAPSRE